MGKVSSFYLFVSSLENQAVMYEYFLLILGINNFFKDDKGTDSLAVQLADEKHWDELVIIIAVVCTFFSVILLTFVHCILLSCLIVIGCLSKIFLKLL